jgi:hypothetical protein
MAEFTGSRTEAHLRQAFATAILAHRHYMTVAQQADAEGNHRAAALFRAMPNPGPVRPKGISLDWSRATTRPARPTTSVWQSWTDLMRAPTLIPQWHAPPAKRDLTR